jgi:hypothetical protein
MTYKQQHTNSADAYGILVRFGAAYMSTSKCNTPLVLPVAGGTFPTLTAVSFLCYSGAQSLLAYHHYGAET